MSHHLRHITKQISAESFSNLVASGQLNKREGHVLRVLYEQYPKALTAQEVTALVQVFYPNTKVNTISCRFAPLIRKGLIEFVEKRQCTQTKSTAGTWRYLGGEILKTLPPPSHKDRLITCLKTYMAHDRCRCSDPQLQGSKCLKCLSEDAIENKR